MTFEEFWKENYEGLFGPESFPLEPYYGIASYAWEMGQREIEKEYEKKLAEIDKKLSEVV